ncbi:MAG: hypothetical protein HZA61_04430 [Candidatus Eisenbacteria bacterium]|uniref:Alginate export domain-containing protein n=1 Tax=Eiseniibacteriota bacterium TaxID=2212470 RepID=A0A933W7R1_UNCEI|nr:hypothetical protein [Candidatus Eisenbacteria bacterium]
MFTHKQRSIAVWLLALLLAAATAARADEPAAEAEEDDSVPAGLSYALEATASNHHVKGAWFTPDSSFDWSEGFARARVFYGFGKGAHVTAGGVVMRTQGTDYFGTQDENDGLLDQLALVVPNAGESGFGFTIGRQSFTLGDGFLIADGYYDHRAALWNIPLAFYDGVSANWTQGPHHATAFAFDVSPSFGDPGDPLEGFLAGGEFGWTPSEGNDLALGFVRMDETKTDRTPFAVTVRGSSTRGPWVIGGEFVFEGGSMGDVDLSGRGGHAEVVWTGEGRFKPTVKLQGFWFSGDDPATDTEDEGYDPWQFGWSDWSNWYVGDLLGSTVLTSSNMRTLLAQVGLTPREGTGFRVLAHRFDRVETEGDSPFAYEFDAVVDQELPHGLSAWVMGAYAMPLDAAKVEFGSENSMQLFAALSWKFSGKLAQ